MKLSEIRVSRCTISQSPPLLWHYWREPREPSPVVVEIVAASQGLNDAQKIERLAAIRQRMNAAAKGELFAEDDTADYPPLKPVWRDPALWEIRWDLDGVPWRMYHAEPGSAPRYLVALRFHEKDLNGSVEKVRDAQNAEIDLASRRFNENQSSWWGLP